MRTKQWKRRVGTKLCLSFSKSRLERNIAALKLHNDNLRTLCTQTRSHRLTSSYALSRPFQVARSDLRWYEIIRTASRLAYKSCLHEAYWAPCPFSSRGWGSHLWWRFHSKVKFNMGFKDVTLVGVNNSGDPIWFVLNTTINDQKITLLNE